VAKHQPVDRLVDRPFFSHSVRPSILSVPQYVYSWDSSVRQFFSPSICQSVSVSVLGPWGGPWGHLSHGQSVSEPARSSVNQSVRQSVRPSVHQSVSLSVSQSVCSSVCPSVRQSVSQSVSQFGHPSSPSQSVRLGSCFFNFSPWLRNLGLVAHLLNLLSLFRSLFSRRETGEREGRTKEGLFFASLPLPPLCLHRRLLFRCFAGAYLVWHLQDKVLLSCKCWIKNGTVSLKKSNMC